MPTATLTLLLGGYLLSGDHKVLRAVYGHDVDLAAYGDKKWLPALRAGGNASALRELQRDSEQTVALSGRLVFFAFQQLWTKISPIAALLVGGAAVLLYRHASPATRQHLVKAVNAFTDRYSEIAAQSMRETTVFNALTVAVPTWNQMAQTMSPEAVLTRACIYTLARDARGEHSARELADALDFLPVPHSEPKVRAVLRGSPAFHEWRRGRFQVGRPIEAI